MPNNRIDGKNRLEWRWRNYCCRLLSRNGRKSIDEWEHQNMLSMQSNFQIDILAACISYSEQALSTPCITEQTALNSKRIVNHRCDILFFSFRSFMEHYASKELSQKLCSECEWTTSTSYTKTDGQNIFIILSIGQISFNFPDAANSCPKYKSISIRLIMYCELYLGHCSATLCCAKFNSIYFEQVCVVCVSLCLHFIFLDVMLRLWHSCRTLHELAEVFALC